MFTLIAIAIVSAHLSPQQTDNAIRNAALSQEVMAAMPLNRTSYEFVVSNDGSTVFSLFSMLNRFSTRDETSKVGEVLVFRRVQGKDWCLTMSQSAHARAEDRNQKNFGIDLVAASKVSEVTVQYTTALGSYLTHVNMDQRGPLPNEVFATKYLWHATKDIVKTNLLWGFRKRGNQFSLDCDEIKAGVIRRISTALLPNELHPLAFDPTSRRVLALRNRDHVAIYHPKSRSMRQLPIPGEQGRYWLSRGEVYFQGTGKLLLARGTKWESVSDDVLLGKSANDKYWLLRRNGSLILRTFL